MNLRLIPFLILASLNGCAGFSALLAAEQDTNIFSRVSTRNVFGLVPETNTTNNSVEEIARPKIVPDGMMTIFGSPQVLFKVLPVSVPNQTPVATRSYILGVGEKQDGIEVEKIDGQAGLITFNNHGLIQALSLTSGGGDGEPGAAAAKGTPPSHRLVSAVRRDLIPSQADRQQSYLRDLGRVSIPDQLIAAGISPTSGAVPSTAVANPALPGSGVNSPESLSASTPAANTQVLFNTYPAGTAAPNEPDGYGGDVPPLPPQNR